MKDFTSMPADMTDGTSEIIQVLHQAMDAVVMMDELNNVTFFNPAAERLGDIPLRKLWGRTSRC